jgi:hypothetical protein
MTGGFAQVYVHVSAGIHHDRASRGLIADQVRGVG